MIGPLNVEFILHFMCQGDDFVLQKAVTLVLQNREDFVAILFYASWCPFSKIFRTDFQKLSSFFPTIAHFSFEESRIKPRCVHPEKGNLTVSFD
jgi:thiol-disulfide isomerase/thioredoxin